MKRFHLSNAAQNDLRRIGREGKAERGEAQAERYLRALDACFHQLGEFPEMGHRCDDVRPGYRSFPVGAHHVYYRADGEDGVFIARIRPQRMLPRKDMLGEGEAS